ncbi:DUF6415 family natural product biosynthesis protein [Streptomyces murinus]|uniref:DUF6415 family natural product biosynthesis protein n=1 Tax=Streptomyces murinus TaxID=33900 RepID=UPI0038157357
MAPLTPAVPSKDEALAIIDQALAWDLDGPGPPTAVLALEVSERLTIYGRVLAADLRTLCASAPADLDADHGAQAALGEAAGRLYLPPPYYGTAQSIGRRAQNIARLVQALHTAVVRVSEEQARTGPTPLTHTDERHQH